MSREARGTVILIAISVIVFVADLLGDHTILVWGAKSRGIWAGEWYRLVTANFIHSGITHLLFDMYALFIFGRLVEQLAGTPRLVAIYLIGGIIGFGTSLLTHPESLSVGASASIFALMGYTLHYRLRRLPLRWLSIDSAFAQILGINFVLGMAVPAIDQFAHLGGLLGGFLTGSLIGLPSGQRRGRRLPGEGAAALVLLGAFLWFTLSPTALGNWMRPLIPGVAEQWDARFDKYFVAWVPTDTSLLWVDPSGSGGDWTPVRSRVTLGANQPVAFGVFWRWTAGITDGGSVGYEVLWERRKGEEWSLYRRDTGEAAAADPQADRIYRRSMILGERAERLTGRWRVRVLVEKIVQFTKAFDLKVGE